MIRQHLIIVMLTLALSLSACSNKSQQETIIDVWAHHGQESENVAMEQMVTTFNEHYAAEGLRAEITFFPDYQYTEKVMSAAAARTLPDVLEIDGPLLSQFVDAGLVMSLDEFITQDARDDFLPTIIDQGSVNDSLYALGAFDSAMVLYYDRDMFEKAGVPIPDENQGWSWDEFMAHCEKLKAAGMLPVSMHMNESSDEWYTYAFCSVIWSAGGRLISEDGSSVEGVLNSPGNVAALKKWQDVFSKGYALNAPVEMNPFGVGKSAMDWSGHWMAPSHVKAKVDKLGVMPLPHIKTLSAPSGSWCWGIAATTDHPDTAWLWVQWVTDSEKGIVPIVQANGAVPARISAFSQLEHYQQSPYRLFRRQLEEWARPRPKTPMYPSLTRHFAAALRDIANGADVKDQLNGAVEDIEQEKRN